MMRAGRDYLHRMLNASRLFQRGQEEKGPRPIVLPAKLYDDMEKRGDDMRPFVRQQRLPTK